MEQEKKKDSVFIGEKPISSYIKGIDFQFSRNKKVTVGARGKWISKLVSIAEISKRNGFKVENMTIGTDSFKNKEGKDINASFMEIVLVK